jgi:RNA polymerase primary sigma factor
MDELENVELSPEQIEKVYNVLESMDIEIIGDMREVEVEEEELDLTIPEGISIDDPVRMYLKK